MYEKGVGLPRRICAFDGDGFLGSREGAKSSVDFAYLAPVLNDRATVRALCEARRVVREPDSAGGGYVVHYRDLREKWNGIVRAKRVVLAAGTMNTLRLLFEGQRRNDLAVMPSLGSTFGGNGDAIGVFFRNSAGPSTLPAPPVLGQFRVDGANSPFFGLAAGCGLDTLPLPSWAKRRLERMVLVFAIGADSGKASAHCHGCVVPAKPANKAAVAVAELVEERHPAKGNTDGEAQPGRRAGIGVSRDLDRVREVAVRDKQVRFTALMHHITVDRLRRAYWAISPKAAPGTDGVTWGAYRQDLEANLADLHQRVHRGSFRATPSRRVYIPKADGRLRPLGIAALEDKIVQRAVVEVLNAVLEADFRNFSYGFRPRRGPHDALDALAVGIERRKVNWVLDADIRDFLDVLSHCSFR